MRDNNVAATKAEIKFGGLYLVDRKVLEKPDAVIVLSADCAVRVSKWAPAEAYSTQNLNAKPAASAQALAQLLRHDYGDENVFVAEPVVEPKAPCPNCGADTGTSEGKQGLCPNCGYKL